MITGQRAAAIRPAASATASASTSGSLAAGRTRRRMRPVRHDVHHVAGQLDIARPLVARRRAPARGRCGGKRCCGSSSWASAPHSRRKTSAWVWKSLTLWCSSGLLNRSRRPGAPADHDHRRLLGIGPGDRIAEAQPAHAIGHADRADAVDPGVGVGGKAGAVLARAADQPQRALFHHRVERQHVVAGDAENVPHAVVAQTADKVLADRNARERLLAAGQGVWHGVSSGIGNVGTADLTLYRVYDLQCGNLLPVCFCRANGFSLPRRPSTLLTLLSARDFC